MKLITTVDIVLLTLQEGRLQVALFERDRDPYQGKLALPGGYIHPEEDHSAEAAAARVLKQKTGLTSPYLEQLRTFSGPYRDPRGWSMSVVHYALVASQWLAGTVRLFPVTELPALPFDHHDIIDAAVERVRSKATYSSLPVHLCGDEFTVPELHQTYEAVLGEKLNMANFRRKLDDLAVLEEVPGAMRMTGRNRPAQLYRVRKEFAHKLSVRERGL